MANSIIKASTSKIIFTVLNFDSIPAILTGSSITCLIKKDRNDPDIQALLTKTLLDGVSIISATDGKGEVLLSSTDTNLSFQKIYFEILVKLSTGTHIRSGVQEIAIQPNVIKVLN